MFALVFLIGGFIAINKWGTSPRPVLEACSLTVFHSTGGNTGYASHSTGFHFRLTRFALSPVGEHVVTQKSLYTVLFVIGIPLLWWAGPFSTLFWLIGASLVLILSHAALIEPGVESEYAAMESGTGV